MAHPALVQITDMLGETVQPDASSVAAPFQAECIPI